eukprot:CAMPEP_0174953836 /NCGR_PEP_ID=MMETSP0004_2-20121128/83_1 /TAXON_ID=420556 /ORGANISM="Ochromonas sp., Strain CCMP1393" /LENGTH=456 /DNA_ID=CAMNT_0016201569 /DNA_START=26 /DNA_END=1396 /DNA_ORIENTATION=-
MSLVSNELPSTDPNYNNLLLRLPQPITSELLTVWMKEKDVIDLDTSFGAVSKGCRDRWLNLLGSDGTVFGKFEIGGARSGAQFTWIVRRMLRLKRVFVSAFLRLQELAVFYFETVGHSIQSIIVDEPGTYLDELYFVICRTCPNLRDLDLSTNTIHNGLNMVLESCATLERLDLSNCEIENDCEGLFEGLICPSMRCVWALTSDLRDELLLSLVISCPGLIEINLDESDEGSEDALWSIAEHCRYLETLTLSGPRISSPALIQLSQRCENLTNLNLNDDCGFIDNDTMRTMMGNCKHLKSFCVLGNTELTDDALVAIAECGSRDTLEKISLIQFRHVSDTGLAQLVANLPALTSIALDDVCITNAALSAIASSCSSKLKSLRLIEIADDVLDLGISSVASACNNLESVAIIRCSSNGDGLMALLDHGRALRSVTYRPVDELSLKLMKRLRPEIEFN